MKILICDSLEKEVIDIFSEIGEVTNISDDENKLHGIGGVMGGLNLSLIHI